ncbi:MAG TPA: DUF2752 domain-containing protein [Nitrospirota bacterium]|nr:DUF2752 domain-containing protein [Nitrospirota bacterium]
MQVTFKKRERGGIEFGIIYGGIAVAALAVPWFLPVRLLSPSCAFKGLFDIPCPTCGATRAVVHLSHGEIAFALAMNPLISIAMVFAVLFFFYSLITLLFDSRRIGFILTEREKNAVRSVAIVLLLIQWGWLIRTL